jgi:hypothetical protein
MLIRNRGAVPIVDASAFVAPTAVLVGRVSVGPRARVMYGAVLDSEASKVEVGATAIVCENAVLRATSVGGRRPASCGGRLRLRRIPRALPTGTHDSPYTPQFSTPCAGPHRSLGLPLKRVRLHRARAAHHLPGKRMLGLRSIG